MIHDTPSYVLDRLREVVEDCRVSAGDLGATGRNGYTFGHTIAYLSERLPLAIMAEASRAERRARAEPRRAALPGSYTVVDPVSGAVLDRGYDSEIAARWPQLFSETIHNRPDSSG